MVFVIRRMNRIIYEQAYVYLIELKDTRKTCIFYFEHSRVWINALLDWCVVKLQSALQEARSNSDVLVEYRELYGLQRRRLESNVELLSEELRLWCDLSFSLAGKVHWCRSRTMLSWNWPTVGINVLMSDRCLYHLFSCDDMSHRDLLAFITYGMAALLSCSDSGHVIALYKLSYYCHIMASTFQTGHLGVLGIAHWPATLPVWTVTTIWTHMDSAIFLFFSTLCSTIQPWIWFACISNLSTKNLEFVAC